MADKIDVWQGTLALMVLRTLEVLRRAARVRDRAADRGDESRQAHAELRHALSRAAQARAGRLHQGRVGRVGEQSAREILPAHGGREEAARRAKRAIGGRRRSSSRPSSRRGRRAHEDSQSTPGADWRHVRRAERRRRDAGGVREPSRDAHRREHSAWHSPGRGAA